MLYQPKNNHIHIFRSEIHCSFAVVLFFFFRSVYSLHFFSFFFWFIIKIHPNGRLGAISTPMSMCNIFNLKSLVGVECVCVFFFCSFVNVGFANTNNGSHRISVGVQRVCSRCLSISLVDLNDEIKASVLE